MGIGWPFYNCMFLAGVLAFLSCCYFREFFLLCPSIILPTFGKQL